MSSFVVVDLETTGLDPFTAELLCVGIGERVYPPKEGEAMLRRLMLRPGTVIAAHTNFDCRFALLRGARLGPSVHFHDTKVMAWLLDGAQPLDLASLVERYCGYTPPKLIRQVAKRAMLTPPKLIRQVAKRAMFDSPTVGLVPIEEAPWDELAAYNRSDLQAEGDLYEALRAELQKSKRWNHFLVEEAPFSRLLVEMETAGMPFDREAAEEMLVKLEADMENAETWLKVSTSAPNFNLRSGDQVARFLYTEAWTQDVRFEIPRLNGMTKEAKLSAVESIAPRNVRVTRVGRDYAYGELLLDGLGLKPPRRGKQQKTSRPSVSGKTLAVLYGENPWISEYVDWKKKDKLAGYLRDWIARVHEGRLYGRFDQSGTITGRLAAREPNLQQVATDSEVRGLFRGDLVVGDYGGLEVRISAHFSLEPVMLDVFRSGGDLYGTLAARAWGGAADKTNEGRGLMKVLMLASQYGAGPEQLSVILAIAGMRGYTPQKAGELLNDFRRTLPRLFAWRDEVIADATRDGYVTTLAGRRRDLVGLRSPDWKKKGKAERQAVNSLVQGSAADIVRRAMLRARDAIDPSVARICLQVHDEILWTRGPEWDDDVFPEIITSCQYDAFELEVPLVFEAKIAQSWGEKDGSAGQVTAGAYEHLNADVNP